MLAIDALFKGYWQRRSDIEYYGLDAERDGVDRRFAQQSMQMLLRGCLCRSCGSGAEGVGRDGHRIQGESSP